MLVINRGANNTWILTLTELKTLTTPYYLFKITSDYNNVTKTFIASDLSAYSDRYNQFLITETSGTEILTSGTVTMNPAGFWSYEVYEQASSSNLNVAAATTLLERGKILVIGTDITINRRDTSITYKGHGI